MVRPRRGGAEVGSSAPSLTPRQAYLAMFEFLRRYYQRGRSGEIGGLLGSLSLLPDGRPADPAHWSDWEESVKAVVAKEGHRQVDLQLE
jgi:hypothetical protein